LLLFEQFFHHTNVILIITFINVFKGLDEDEAISLMSVGVDFGVTQVDIGGITAMF
jgi:acetamidase/formamidase